MTRGYNFGAGPAMLPEDVLRDVQTELLDWQGRGMSVMEIGHRTESFKILMQSAEKNLRELLRIPDNYQVLFLGGPARTQFAMIPMNFLSADDIGGYIISGLWSSMAFKEALTLKKAHIIASEEEKGFLSVPHTSHYTLRDDLAYIYYTPNETVNGVQYSTIPNAGTKPLIADMTSCLLTEPIDVSQFGLIFAGAQKNIANAGLTLVIIRDDLLSMHPNESLPTMLDYRVHAEHHSLYATPPGFNCYIASKMFEWIKKQGGVEALYQINCQKAEKLYSFIDSSDLYYCPVAPDSRSKLNICFYLTQPCLNDQFLSLASEQKLYALAGHRSTGGMRASLYNAMPMAGVERLIHYMREFSEDYHH